MGVWAGAVVGFWGSFGSFVLGERWWWLLVGGSVGLIVFRCF